MEGAPAQLIDQWGLHPGGKVQALPRLTAGVIIRIGLVALFVIGCHLFDWRLLRFLTAECISRMSNWMGIAMSRVSFDTVAWATTRFQFVVACTQIDVFFGAIPLIWNMKISVWRNALKLGAFFCCLFLFNLIRLELGFVLFARGLTWFWAHEFTGGIALFVIFLWVVRQLRMAEDFSPARPETCGAGLAKHPGHQRAKDSLIARPAAARVETQPAERADSPTPGL
jgi:hypothetical protein